MTDTRFERDLRAALDALAPSDVPDAVREAVAAVPRRPTRRGGVVSRTTGAAVLLAAAAVTIAVVLLAGPVNLGGVGGHGAATPSASPTAATGTVEYQLQPLADETLTAADLEATLAVIRARIAGLQAAATADAAPPDRIRVTAPATVPDELTQILGTTGRFDIVPLGSTQLETGMQVDEARFQPLFAGDQVDTLASGQDQSGQPTLEISLTPQATTAFANYTRDHVGDFLAIVLDGSVLSAPVINAPITDGHISITSGSVGEFDPATVRKLAVVVETGPLPYPLVEVAHTP